MRVKHPKHWSKKTFNMENKVRIYRESQDLPTPDGAKTISI